MTKYTVPSQLNLLILILNLVGTEIFLDIKGFKIMRKNAPRNVNWTTNSLWYIHAIWDNYFRFSVWLHIIKHEAYSFRRPEQGAVWGPFSLSWCRFVREPGTLPPPGEESEWRTRRYWTQSLPHRRSCDWPQSSLICLKTKTTATN